MTRVLIIEAAGNLWGSERSLLDMLTAMPGIDVAVCCPPGRPLVVELQKRGIRTLPTFVYRLHEKSRWERLGAAVGVFQACLTFRPHVLYLNQSGSYKVALPAARLLNIPIVGHIRIFEDAEYLAGLQPDPRRLRGIIANSLAVERAIRQFSSLDPIPLHRIYNAYAPQPAAAPPIPPARDRIACIGRLVPVKGQEVLIGAVDWLRRSGSRVECLMVGEGDQTFARRLKTMAADLDVASSIEWAGFIGDVGPLLRSCSVLVCPSHREPLGRVIYEAWDAGVVPIVFAGSGGAAEIVSSADGGILYDEQTPESLGKALREALNLDPDARARLVRNGRAWLAAHCDPAAYGVALAAILGGVSPDKPSPIDERYPVRTRALVIEAAGNLWGSERSLLDLLEAMPGLDLAVCCPPGRALNSKLAELRIRALPYYVHGLHEKSRRQRLLAAIGVARACLAFRPDVLYLNQSGSYKVALPAARLFRIPIVAHIRIFEDAAYLARQTPDPGRLRGLIAISHAIEAEIRRFRQLDAIPLHRLYDGYLSSRRWVRPSTGEPPVTRVACVGRLVPIKGQDIFVRALALLKDSPGPAVECLIVGEGDERFARMLRQLANVGGVDAAIRWPGFVRDIDPLLRTCDVLACPSHREPLGRVIFEAWDAGAVPVVFAGSGGAAEIVSAAEGGFLYDTQEPQALARALRRALDLTPEQAARLIANGRAWMAENCHPDGYGRRLEAILTEAGGSPAIPA